ncbi:hypothetical protein ANANG_G00119090 [Anguilla anguilla]|uniref:Uncharacterized protein n=1 Tax=Anguilla anguilla TaxID=7936 RepID=A0A9D3MD50_ANGAN|nr:hypothetical protein ANANG_G00119090 [Anguilla anguilla]
MCLRLWVGLCEYFGQGTGVVEEGVVLHCIRSWRSSSLVMNDTRGGCAERRDHGMREGDTYLQLATVFHSPSCFDQRPCWRTALMWLTGSSPSIIREAPSMVTLSITVFSMTS